jgi:hypothetical protein
MHQRLSSGWRYFILTPITLRVLVAVVGMRVGEGTKLSDRTEQQPGRREVIWMSWKEPPHLPQPAAA